MAERTSAIQHDLSPSIKANLYILKINRYEIGTIMHFILKGGYISIRTYFKLIFVVTEQANYSGS